MENLIEHLSGPNQTLVGFIKLPSGAVVSSPSKWLSDRWFLNEINFGGDKTCVEITPFKNSKDSNVFVGEKYLNHKVYKRIDEAPKDIDFLSIIDPDNALEVLEYIDFSKYSIKHFCIAINPLKEKNFKQNRREIQEFMKDHAQLIKQNRTELLYKV